MAVALGFFAGGALLSAVEWQRAWRPPLRLVFEARARADRMQAAADGRRLPEDDEAFAVVEGTLRSDAAIGGSGASLSVAVDGWKGGWAGRAAGTDGSGGWGRWAGRAGGRVGGILVTVVGSLAAERIDDWRAGRRVRDAGAAPPAIAVSRPGRSGSRARAGPPRHDAGRHGEERCAGGGARARHAGSTKRLATVRAFARRAIAAAVGRWSAAVAAIVAAIVIGDRAGLDEEVQRRLQEAGTYHVIAISGGNIAILAGLLLGAFRVAGCSAGRDAGGDRRAARVRAAGRRRRVGRSRDADGGGLLRRPGARSAQRAAQRAGAGCCAAGRRRPAVGCRSGVRAHVRRDARPFWSSVPVGASSSGCRARSARGRCDACRVGGGRGDAVSGRRAGVLARHVRRPGAELRWRFR